MSPAEPDVDVSALEYVHNPIRALNEKWVRHLRAESAPVVLERFHELTAAGAHAHQDDPLRPGMR